MDIKQYYSINTTTHHEIYEYININKNMNLRNDITIFFYNKIKKWIIKYPKFNKFKNITINNEIIYNILRKIVKQTGLNWYDLRTNYSKLKKYFIKYLKNHN
jgi:hypothetical protein